MCYAPTAWPSHEIAYFGDNVIGEIMHPNPEIMEAFDAYRMKILTYPKEYTDVWFPGHMTFCKWMIGNLENESTASYGAWEPRKAEAINSGVKGRGMGYGTSYYYSFIKEPLTLDFSKAPEGITN